MQPLDVGLFLPLATRYGQQLDQYIFNSEGISSVTKGDFFRLFWPAFEQAFTPTNVLSSFAKTGISPFSPVVVLDKMQSALNSRPTTASSADNGPAPIKQRKKVRFVNEVKHKYAVHDNTAIKLDKIVDKLCGLEAENTILKEENSNCRQALFEAQKKKTRAKTVIEQLRSENSSGALVFSPGQIARSRELTEQKELAEQAQETAKQAARDSKRAQAAAAAVAKESSRLVREEQAKRKRLDLAAKLSRQQHQKEASKTSQQLALDLQASAKKPKSLPKRTGPSKVVVLSIEPAKLAGVLELASSRSGRVLQAPRFLNS